MNCRCCNESHIYSLLAESLRKKLSFRFNETSPWPMFVLYDFIKPVLVTPCTVFLGLRLHHCGAEKFTSPAQLLLIIQLMNQWSYFYPNIFSKNALGILSAKCGSLNFNLNFFEDLYFLFLAFVCSLSLRRISISSFHP